MPAAAGTGRRRVWCSPKCRRAAHVERLAAERAGQAVTVVEVPRGVPAPPAAEVLLDVARGADVPAAVAVVNALSERVEDGAQSPPMELTLAATRLMRAVEAAKEAADQRRWQQIEDLLLPPAQRRARQKARERMHAKRTQSHVNAESAADATPAEALQAARQPLDIDGAEIFIDSLTSNIQQGNVEEVVASGDYDRIVMAVERLAAARVEALGRGGL